MPSTVGIAVAAAFVEASARRSRAGRRSARERHRPAG
jgi:hypothetical protein